MIRFYGMDSRVRRPTRRISHVGEDEKMMSAMTSKDNDVA